MPLDGIAIHQLKNELSALLVGGKVDKVYQPTRDELILSVRREGSTLRVLFSASPKNARVSVTDIPRENPQTPPTFCMLLRKHLTGGRILSVKQPSLERIIEVSIECRNELGDLVTYRLIGELMGKHSNVICVDENDRIIDSIRHVDLSTSAVRTVLPGILYVAPPFGDRQNPLTVPPEALAAVFTSFPSGEKLSDALISHFVGLSPLAAREVVYRAYRSVDLFVGEAGDLAPLTEAFCAFRDAILTGSEKAYLVIDGQKMTDFSAYAPTQYEGFRCWENVPSLIDAMERFYESRDRQERLSQKSAALLKKVKNELSRCYKKKALHEAKLKEAAGRESARIKGELITANLYRIQPGDTLLECENYYEENAPLVRIPLDPTLSPAENAQKYYARYNKFKHAEEAVTRQLSLCEDEIQYLESVLLLLENAKDEQSVRESREELVKSGYIRSGAPKGKRVKELKLSAPTRVEWEGYEIFVGKNNLQNDYLTLKLSRANDLWLHAKGVPASHVIVKYQGEEIPPSVITRAAEIAAFHSKAKNAPKVEVDYTPVKNVKKPSGAKPGMVIYDHYQTAYVAPVEE